MVLTAPPTPVPFLAARWSSDLRDRLLTHVIEPPVLAQKAVAAIRDATDLPFVSLALRAPSGVYAMHGAAGARHLHMIRQIQVTPGQGLGGRAVNLRRSLAVASYATDGVITAHFKDMAEAEGLGAMVAVPVFYENDPVALLYGGARGRAAIGDQTRRNLELLAVDLAGLFGTAVRHSATVIRRIGAEREQIAQDLHDTVGQLLFSIGVSARRLREDSSDPAVGARHIEAQVGETVAHLRAALRVLGPQDPEEVLPVAAQLDVNGFTARTGVPAQLIVLGKARRLSPDDEATLLCVTRTALHNAEEHARAGSVLVTLDFGDETVRVAVQDDGRGLPAGFALRPVHGDDRGWGLPGTLRRVQQRGGRLDVMDADEGGTIVRAELPVDG